MWTAQGLPSCSHILGGCAQEVCGGECCPLPDTSWTGNQLSASPEGSSTPTLSLGSHYHWIRRLGVPGEPPLLSSSITDPQSMLTTSQGCLPVTFPPEVGD